MIRGVVFDMDGLMFDTERIGVEAWLEAARQTGVPLSREAVLSTLGLNNAATRAALEPYLGTQYQQCEDFERSFMAAHIQNNGIVIKPGLFELLDYLQKCKYRFTMATSSSRERARFFLKESGVQRHFDDIVCGDMIARSKPEPDIYLQACELINLPPAKCLALEDAPAGLLAAHRAGLMPVFIRDLIEPDPRISKLLFARLDTLHDVVDLLESKGAYACGTKPL